MSLAGSQSLRGGGERIERHTLVRTNDILMRNRMGLKHIYVKNISSLSNTILFLYLSFFRVILFLFYF